MWNRKSGDLPGALHLRPCAGKGEVCRTVERDLDGIEPQTFLGEEGAEVFIIGRR